MADQQQGGGFLQGLGSGLQSAGEVLSPRVYEQKSIERREALPNMLRALQIENAQRALKADQSFADAIRDKVRPGMGSSAMLEALNGIDPGIVSQSPAAQTYLKQVAQQQNREAMQEQRRQNLQFQYDGLEQRRQDAERRSQDARASAEERARHNLEMERLTSVQRDIQRQLADARTSGGPNAPQRDYKAEYEKMDPAGQTALDMQAWNYINKNTLPYRKGTGGGADRNDPIIHRAGEIANTLGIQPQELSAKSAEFKANAQALYFQTKKLNAVQGTLESFHNNIATWDSIAEGEVPKIGGAKLSEIQDKLRKIDFSDVKTLNDWEIKVRTQFNDPAMVAYVTSAFTVAMDYSRILSSQGQSAAAVTEGARNEALKLVSAGYNKNARKALIGVMESDAAGQIKGLETQTNRLRGKMGLRAEASTAEPEKPQQAATSSGPKVGDKSTSKSGKPIHWDGKQWVYD